jgi:hypothetical protein
MDYSYEYNGASLKVPKNKIFNCIDAINDVTTVTELSSVFTENDFIKAAKLFCILASYSGKTLDPMDVTQHYLYSDGGAMEVYKGVNGIIELLAPPESYNPPVVESAGKSKAA